MSVLVTDAILRHALAVIRSLGKQKLEITAGETTPFATSFFSKYCNYKLIYPSPQTNPNEFINILYNLCKKKKYSAYFPVSVESTLLFSKYKQKFAKYVKIPVVDYSTFIKAWNKKNTLQIAIKNNIPTPKTYFINDLQEVHTVAQNIKFPVVVKPQESSGSRGLYYAYSPKELIQLYYLSHQQFPYPIIQEYIPGNEIYGFSALFDIEHRPRAMFIHKRLRQYPISGGPSVLRISTSHPKVQQFGEKLLKALKWIGVAMVEFKIDSRDNTPKLMEINPRFWGSTQLAIQAGIDFPALLYKLLIEGEDIKKNFKYKLGIKCRFLLYGDILYFLDAPNKLKLLPSFLKLYEPNMGYDIFSRTDFGPTFGQLLGMFTQFFNPTMRASVFRKKR